MLPKNNKDSRAAITTEKSSQKDKRRGYTRAYRSQCSLSLILQANRNHILFFNEKKTGEMWRIQNIGVGDILRNLFKVISHSYMYN